MSRLGGRPRVEERWGRRGGGGGGGGEKEESVQLAIQQYVPSHCTSMGHSSVLIMKSKEP